MNLLLDLGNSRLKWAWHDTDAYVETGAEAVAEVREVPWPAGWQGRPAPARIIGVCVGDAALWGRLVAEIEQRWGCPVDRVTTPSRGGGIRCAYRDPARFGTDRWAAMVGARRLGPLPALVIDCGTAITADWVDPGGHHRGGVIISGLDLQFDALGRRAPALAGRHAAEPALFATDTEAAIVAGAVFGTVGAIETLAQRMEAERGPAARRWLAGGDAPALHPYLRSAFTLRPELVFDGLLALLQERP